MLVARGWVFYGIVLIRFGNEPQMAGSPLTLMQRLEDPWHVFHEFRKLCKSKGDAPSKDLSGAQQAEEETAD